MIVGRHPLAGLSHHRASSLTKRLACLSKLSVFNAHNPITGEYCIAKGFALTE